MALGILWLSLYACPFLLTQREGARLLSGDLRVDGTSRMGLETACFWLLRGTHRLLGMTLFQFLVPVKEILAFWRPQRPDNLFQGNVLNYRCFFSVLSSCLRGQSTPSPGRGACGHVVVERRAKARAAVPRFRFLTGGHGQCPKGKYSLSWIFFSTPHRKEIHTFLLHFHQARGLRGTPIFNRCP